MSKEAVVEKTVEEVVENVAEPTVEKILESTSPASEITEFVGSKVGNPKMIIGTVVVVGVIVAGGYFIGKKLKAKAVKEVVEEVETEE